MSTYPQNSQEILNKVWQHFIVENNPYSVNKTGSCKYRQNLKSDCAIKCAVGLFIPNELYKPVFDSKHYEVMPFSEFINACTMDKSLFNFFKRNYLFLGELREAHDNAACFGHTKELFAAKLREIAQQRKLTIP